MSATGKNFERIAEAKTQHNAGCAFPAHTVVMNPFDIERLGWEVGDTIAGLTLAADDQLQVDRFNLLCDRDAEPEQEAVEAVAAERPLVGA